MTLDCRRGEREKIAAVKGHFVFKSAFRASLYIRQTPAPRGSVFFLFPVQHVKTAAALGRKARGGPFLHGC